MDLGHLRRRETFVNMPGIRKIFEHLTCFEIKSESPVAWSSRGSIWSRQDTTFKPRPVSQYLCASCIAHSRPNIDSQPSESEKRERGSEPGASGSCMGRCQGRGDWRGRNVHLDATIPTQSHYECRNRLDLQWIGSSPDLHVEYFR